MQVVCTRYHFCFHSSVQCAGSYLQILLAWNVHTGSQCGIAVRGPEQDLRHLGSNAHTDVETCSVTLGQSNGLTLAYFLRVLVRTKWERVKVWKPFWEERRV